jgi:hypothetical protein
VGSSGKERIEVDVESGNFTFREIQVVAPRPLCWRSAGRRAGDPFAHEP